MQETSLGLFLLAPPVLGLAIVALGHFVSRWRNGATIAILVCAALVVLTLSFIEDKRAKEVATNFDASGRVADASPSEEPLGQFGFDRWTAVYDISAHTVHLPNGSKLEAHSGLGSRLDDPRFVHERMRGSTPPNIYTLTLREKPFHGVRALRLAPLDRDKVFGRTGLLAHSYMLGPAGDSNGCVVFKNYDAFLRAFEAGDLKRLAVVARLQGETVEQPAAPSSYKHANSASGTRVAASLAPQNNRGAPPKY